MKFKDRIKQLLKEEDMMSSDVTTDLMNPPKASSATDLNDPQKSKIASKKFSHIKSICDAMLATLKDGQTAQHDDRFITSALEEIENISKGTN